MLQLEDTLDNLRGIGRLLNLHRAVVLTDDRLLLSKITNALENQVGSRGRNLYIQLLTQRIHVAADLL